MKNYLSKLSSRNKRMIFLFILSIILIFTNFTTIYLAVMILLFFDGLKEMFSEIQIINNIEVKIHDDFFNAKGNSTQSKVISK